MHNFKSCRRGRTCLMAVLLVTLAAGCGGGRDPILGTGGAGLAPVVTAVTPVNNATGVADYQPLITATFNEPMAAFTGAATYTVTCTAPCINPAGSLSLDGTNTVATFTPST